MMRKTRKRRKFVAYERGEVVPFGTFEGHRLADLSNQHLNMLYGGWNGSERLRATEFFQCICEERSKRLKNRFVNSEVGRLTLGDDGKCLVGTIFGDRIEIRRDGDEYVATKI